MPTPIVAHKPGRRAQVPSLTAMLADNPAADPLIGNYVLVPQQEIVVGYRWAGSSGTSPVQVADRPGFRLCIVDAPSPGAAMEVTGAATYAWFHGTDIHPDLDPPPRLLALAAGDLDGNGRDEIASLMAFRGQLQLMVSGVPLRPDSPTVAVAADAPREARLLCARLVDPIQPGRSLRAALAVAWIGEDGVLIVE
ncbi:MAG TPA: hypothetical protein VES39_05305, partial [Rhodospirillales bacterium]|nr:hypothetical protein [Rhodospirillales bacterium]